MPVESWKEHLHNDFEDHIFNKYPVLSEYKEALYKRGAIYASMSGSGSSIFGLFRKGKKTL
jgi:4-diphosphocytidyl-2-C-methyl-D-erythritol kinase